MKPLDVIVLACLTYGMATPGQDVLPSDRGQREIDVRGPVTAPIRHRKYFRGERELFGYDPRFTPNVLTFDRDNRPYCRDGTRVQTLNADGRWIGLDMSPAIRAAFPDWDGGIRRGPFIEERVVFDAAGDAYTCADLTRCNVRKMLLLHSRDRCRTWDVYVLPRDWYVLEHDNGFNQIDGPPVLARGRGGPFTLVAPRKSVDGTLTIPAPITVAQGECWTTPYHSGGSNVTLSRDGRTHVVWIDVSAPSGHRTLADTYIATYHHDSGTVAGPVLLGHTERDNHNGPVATMDSRGIIHVLIGRHHYPFRYTRSRQPNTIDGGFTPPIEIGRQKRKIGEGSYTYTALACDHNDTLHLATRWAGMDYAFHIAYLRKKADGQWRHEQSLLVPFRNYYSVWYHKFGLDRQRRLFMNYVYYATGLSPEAAREYARKWPDEENFVIPENPEKYVNGIRTRVTWHDPAIMMTDDGGDTWRLALTEDLAQCIDAPLQHGERLPTTLTNSLGMELQLIQPGDFVMGDNQGDFDERPAHAVRISRPFYMGRHEVTVGQFRTFLEQTGYKTLQERTDPDTWYAWIGKVGKTDGNPSWEAPDYQQTDNHPVVCLMRVDAQAFCDWLTQTEGRQYRLPTEAEWEYACRAGTTSAFSFGDDESAAGQYAWYRVNSNRQAHPVGLKKPNPWGLYDMHGNVAEWVGDQYDLYSPARRIDPAGPAAMPDEPKMVIRGGSWLDDPHGPNDAYNLRSSARYYIYFPQILLNWVGFRVVMEPARPPRTATADN